MSFAALKQDQIVAASPVVGLADELPPGTKLLQGQYTIESFLSAGGFGITYVARNSLGRQVVIKECFPSSFCRRTGQKVGVRSQGRQDDLRSMVALFVQEAVNLSRLEHPNIVRVHQVFEDNDTAYMAMDYIQGPDLLETVEGTAPRLGSDRIISLLDRVLDALGHVHARGFLHRDISPDNMLLDSTTGEPVLIDFGAARKDETRKSRALSGLRVVKDGYSPQEFYITGSLQAPCSDLYALGASFSHLITGEAPRTSRERLSALANREGDPQVPLLGRVQGYPDAFLAAIDKAMAIFPRDRLQSVEDWRAALGTTVAVPPAPTAAELPVAEPKSQAVKAEPVLHEGLSTDPWVRAAAILVLLASLGSLVGQVYDRFLAPQQDASFDFELTRTARIDPTIGTAVSPVSSATIPHSKAGLFNEFRRLGINSNLDGYGAPQLADQASPQLATLVRTSGHDCVGASRGNLSDCLFFNALRERTPSETLDLATASSSRPEHDSAVTRPVDAEISASLPAGIRTDSAAKANLPEVVLNNTVATCDFAVQPESKLRFGTCFPIAATVQRRVI